MRAIKGGWAREREGAGAGPAGARHAPAAHQPRTSHTSTRPTPPALPHSPPLPPNAPQNISGTAAQVEASIGTALAAAEESNLPDEIDAVSDEEDEEDEGTPPPDASAAAVAAPPAGPLTLPAAAPSSAPAADAPLTAAVSAQPAGLRPDRGTSVASGGFSTRIDDWLLEVHPARAAHGRASPLLSLSIASLSPLSCPSSPRLASSWPPVLPPMPCPHASAGGESGWLAM